MFTLNWVDEASMPVLHKIPEAQEPSKQMPISPPSRSKKHSTYPCAHPEKKFRGMATSLLTQRVHVPIWYILGP